MIPGESTLTHLVIGAAIEVHRILGPPLLESAYGDCMAIELELRCIPSTRQRVIPVLYKGRAIDASYRVDLLLENLVVEVKAVERLLLVHAAQVLTYMRMLRIRTGLLLNYRSAVMKDGIGRLTLDDADL